MVDEVPLRRAIDTAWAVYLAQHRDIDVADGRRCLLERHLQGRWAARERSAEDLICFGLAYLNRISPDEY